MMARMSETVVDVVIVGGGITGSALALGLARRGVAVVLAGGAAGRQTADVPVQGRQIPEMQVPGGHVSGAAQRRPIALAKGSQRILQRLGVWQRMAPGAQPISTIVVSEKGCFAKVRLSAEEMGTDAFGYVSDALSIQAACDAALDALAMAGARVIRIAGGGLGAMQRGPDGVTIPLDGRGQLIRAALAVGADGSGSRLRQDAGIATRVRRFDQAALTCTVWAQKPIPRRAFERFTRHGPLALLPMGDSRYGLVWCVRSERAERLQSADEGLFADQLCGAFGRAMGRVTPCSEVARFDLESVRAERVVGEKLVLIGNAAHQLHPVAGQGLNLGLRDVDELCALIGKARQQEGVDCGSAPLLQAYRHRRAADHWRMQWATDMLGGIFCSAGGALAGARQGGLLALQLLPLAKRQLARTAMGLLHR